MKQTTMTIITDYTSQLMCSSSSSSSSNALYSVGYSTVKVKGKGIPFV